jgi:hypothetical protein
VSSWCCADALSCSAKLSVAIDGSKFKAVNTRDRNFTQAKMQRRLAQIDESIIACSAPCGDMSLFWMSVGSCRLY